jgi:tRNA (mo5U34)-methyltransferase
MASWAYIGRWRDEFRERGWWHSFELPDGTAIRGVSDLEAQKRRLAQFPIPADLRGKRVLDVGAWDGWFTFEMERRGAEVVAIDRWENPRFWEMRRMLGSRAEYLEMDVYDLSPQRIGRFDIVLFLGVLYHLKHPLLALERVCSVTEDMAAVESYVLDEPGGRTLLEFFEHDEFGGQFDNWFAPSVSCLSALCRTAGFARVELNNVQDYGAAVSCYRKWSHPGPGGSCKLISAVHAENYGVNFRSDRDEYVGCRVEGEPGLPEVGGYGTRPVYSGLTEGGYRQVNFRLPPGLAPGWHEVRLGSANAIEIAVDVPLEVHSLEIGSACDGVTWEKGRMSLANGFLSLWVRGLPRNADIHNVKAWIGGVRQQVYFVAPDGQINLRVSETNAGAQEVNVECGGVRSNPLLVEFLA